MTESPFITMIICTRNRAAQLRQVLQSATEMDIPNDLSWEFIVVDNGSSDGTLDVVISFADRLPIRCVREDMAGLSNARNRGVAEAKGQYICWTDDDVEIDSNWLKAYHEAILRHPEASLFGGEVIPRLLPPTPGWFAKNMNEWPLSNLIAQRLFGVEFELTFQGWKIPWGANFAIKTSEQKKYLYDPELGVSPKHRRVGEETNMMYHLFKNGGSGWWVPGAKVNHIIPASRQTYKYLYQYSYLTGETFAFLRHTYPDDNYLLASGRPPNEYSFSKFELYFFAAKRLCRFSIAWMLNKPSHLRYLRDYAYYMGAASYKEMMKD
ncbi:glycosyltransferase [Methylovorus mays]|uniref:glycosyltransferase n=1 Tax=Methylovorus mays TaxID=184077 RepID=UPI002E1C6C1D|nr:glycosyltransferase [Methylovorus mays]